MTNCPHDYIRTGKRDFLGFPLSVCPACGKTRTEPLTMGYRIPLYLLTALFITLGTAGAGFYVVLILCGLYAVLKDVVLLFLRRRKAA